MTDFTRIRTEIAEILCLPVEMLQADTPLKEISNWDSLAKMATIATVIEVTGTQVSDEDLEQIDTLQDIYDLIQAKKREK